jgi:hypothetical protein
VGTKTEGVIQASAATLGDEAMWIGSAAASYITICDGINTLYTKRYTGSAFLYRYTI